MHLIPAYGRDYKSQKAVEADLKAGKSFIVSDAGSIYDGKPCDLESLKTSGVVRVYVRYGQLRKVCTFTI